MIEDETFDEIDETLDIDREDEIMKPRSYLLINLQELVPRM